MITSGCPPTIGTEPKFDASHNVESGTFRRRRFYCVLSGWQIPRSVVTTKTHFELANFIWSSNLLRKPPAVAPAHLRG